MELFVLKAKCNSKDYIILDYSFNKELLKLKKKELILNNTYINTQLKIKKIDNYNTDVHLKIKCIINNSNISEIIISHNFYEYLETTVNIKEYFVLRTINKNNIIFYVNGINEKYCLDKVLSYIQNKKIYDNRKRICKV